jgi:thiamine-phosphate pyrophosphorylase
VAKAPDGFQLTLVTDRRRAAAGLAGLAAEADRAGIDLVQVREKDLEGRALAALVGAIVAAAPRVRVLVNGRPDVAVAMGAAGVHLPEAGLPVADVRRAFGGLLIGASCHSLEAARRADGDGADFVVVGPVFPTPGKEERTLGLDGLASIASAVAVPVHAIGGLGPHNVRAVAAAGARGMAAIRAFTDAPVGEVVDALRRALEAR